MVQYSSHSPPYQGLDFSEAKVNENFRLYFQDTAPDGYEAWLDRNLADDDPIARSWRNRDSVALRDRSYRSYKCWDDRCLHYIYGFSTQDERHQHVKEHSAFLKRDSGLSVASTPPLVLDQPAHRRDYSDGYSKRPSPLYLPRPAGSLQSMNPSIPGLSRDHKDSLRSYSLASEPSGSARDLRGSVDSEIDPLLPPLKRSRVGQSKLESIGELRLLRDAGVCLQCRISQKGVSDILDMHLLEASSNIAVVRLERPMCILR